jgi:spore germination cell wall hydrolase CwlJ-like protein
VETVRIVELAPGYVAWNPTGGDPLTCLAQAVYFEARSEGEAGQRAVAQVVINRSHMPQYPATICGVVYQGSERATGCQFTFVCDGSLREPSDPTAWGRATDIARQALAGFVYKPMLGATHYHAAWMTPYWSGSLTRIRQIGGQVFYH